MSIPIPIPILIIHGETAVRHTVDRGIFYCPECETSQAYKKKELWKFCHLYFIPLCPIEKMVTYVKCKTCKTRYDPAVLEATKLMRSLQTLWQKAMLRAMIRVMMADGRIDEGEITMIRKIYSAVSEKAITKAFIMKEVETMQAETGSDVTSDLEPVKDLLGDEGKNKIIEAMMLVSISDNQVDREETKVMEQASALLFGSEQGPEKKEGLEEAIASKKQVEKSTDETLSLSKVTTDAVYDDDGIRVFAGDADEKVELEA